MAILITIDWLINDEVVCTETTPVAVDRIEGLEKAVDLSIAGGPQEKLTVRLQFDPALVVPKPAREGARPV